MNSKKRILIFNFALDNNDPVLAHQLDVVRILARHFSEVVVVTGRLGNADLPKNVSIAETDWRMGKNVHNLLGTIIALIRVKAWKNFEIVFFHMVVYQAILAFPFLFFSKSKKFLWYAHKSDSLALRIACSQMDVLLSSTRGSFPFESSKLKLVGQMVDSYEFAMLPPRHNELRRFVHIGRLDSSKQVDKIISALKEVKSQYPKIEFTSYGDSSNVKELNWSQSVLKRFLGDSDLKWIKIMPSIPKQDVAKTLANYDVFIHHYQGSLDKTLIEATLCGIPVVTKNSEYLSEFGSWTGDFEPSLPDEIRALFALDFQSRNLYLSQRRFMAENSHSLQSWQLRVLPLFEINE